MRLWTVPVVALGAVVMSISDEPTERGMRAAFEADLATQVRNALDFVAETGGPQAVAKVRAAGTDRFTINSFHKLGCRRDVKGGYLCRFTVDVGVVNGDMREELTGRFFVRGDGFVFTRGA